MREEFNVDMNDAESIQKGIYFHQSRVLLALIFYPVPLWIFYHIWVQLRDAYSVFKTFENSFIFYILLIYIMGNPLVRILFRLIKIIRLKNYLSELQKKDYIKNRLEAGQLKSQIASKKVLSKTTFAQFIFESFKKSFIVDPKKQPSEQCDPQLAKESINSLGMEKLLLIPLGILAMVCGIVWLCVMFGESQDQQVDNLGMYIFAVLFIVGGFYLTFIEPRKLTADQNELKKSSRDKMHFHSDLK